MLHLTLRSATMNRRRKPQQLLRLPTLVTNRDFLIRIRLASRLARLLPVTGPSLQQNISFLPPYLEVDTSCQLAGYRRNTGSYDRFLPNGRNVLNISTQSHNIHLRKHFKELLQEALCFLGHLSAVIEKPIVNGNSPLKGVRL